MGCRLHQVSKYLWIRVVTGSQSHMRELRGTIGRRCLSPSSYKLHAPQKLLNCTMLIRSGSSSTYETQRTCNVHAHAHAVHKQCACSAHAVQCAVCMQCACSARVRSARAVRVQCACSAQPRLRDARQCVVAEGELDYLQAGEREHQRGKVGWSIRGCGPTVLEAVCMRARGGYG